MNFPTSLLAKLKRLVTHDPKSEANPISTDKPTENTPAYPFVETEIVRNTNIILPAQRPVLSTQPVIVVIGRAGTGKTTLIRQLMQTSSAKQMVVAFTGVAARNVGGQTIHSLFHLPPRITNESELEPVRGSYALFRNLERLIIDEISMVRADLLDNVDQALRVNRRDDRPFGGVQIVMVGDFLQLPPVIPAHEANILESMGYKTPYALSAKCLRHLRPQFFELAKVHRQTDPAFIELLARIRTGKDIESTIEVLNRTCYGPHKGNAKPIILTGRNSTAESHNRAGLTMIDRPSFVYEGLVKGIFEQKNDLFPAPDYLELKVDARTILVKNDPAGRWVNGDLATVSRLESDRIWITLDGDPREHEVFRQSWESIRYTWNEEKKSVGNAIVGSYTQFPIQLAWAMTIHKAQGLTLQNVRVDLRGGAFTEGQAYVALSRARSIEGLSLAQQLTIADVKVSYHLSKATEYISNHASDMSEFPLI